MLRRLMIVLALAMAPTAALAHSCPALMAEIDAALPASTLSEADKAKVTELRQRGAELHEAGDHDGSMSALEEAKGMLGI